jgi:hypothetical protein
MQSLDSPRTNLDNTVRLFDQFYNFDLVVNANQYEIIYSYFYDVSKSKNIAGNFTTMLFRISNVTGVDSLVLLDQMKGVNAIQANALLAYYLNSLRSKTTLYGVNVAPQPNQRVARNVII